MKTIENAVLPDVESDSKSLMNSLLTGMSLDPEVSRRIRERAEEVTQRVYREQGLLDIAVPAIREFRGDLRE